MSTDSSTGHGFEDEGEGRPDGLNAGAPSPPPGANRRRLARSTAVFAGATGLSRVLGLVREMVAAYLFGVTGLINAFTVAFQIPNLVRALVADAALSGAFVPVFSELLESGDRRRAWRVAATIFWLTLFGLGGLTALLVLAAGVMIVPFGDPGGDSALATGLARVLFPIVVLLGLSGIVVGILNVHDHFTIPALTPVVWNAVIIGGLAIGVPLVDGAEAELYVYAGSILAATAVQLAMPLPWLRGLDGRIRPVLDWRDPAVRRFFRLMLPVTLTLGLVNVNATIGMLIASRLVDPELAPAAIDKAFRLYMLPQGIFSVAVATVLFPALSRLAARGDLGGLRRSLDEGLRLIGFLLVPAGVVSALLALPIVRLTYERGAFGAEDTEVVAACLAAFSLGLAFNGGMLLVSRGFYALQANWPPTAVALGAVALNTVLALLLYPVGPWGIPLATSLTNVAGFTALMVLLRRRAGRGDAHAGVSSIARVAAATVPAAAFAALVWWGLDEALGRGVVAQLASLGVALGVGTGAYVWLCRAFGLRELTLLRSLRPRSN